MKNNKMKSLVVVWVIICFWPSSVWASGHGQISMQNNTPWTATLYVDDVPGLPTMSGGVGVTQVKEGTHSIYVKTSNGLTCCAETDYIEAGKVYNITVTGKKGQ